MPQDSKKPKWGKPKLIVLVRGDRQERVLQTCKRMTGIPSIDPATNNAEECNTPLDCAIHCINWAAS